MTASLRRPGWIVAQLALIALAAAAATFFTVTGPSAVSQIQRFTPATLGDQPAGAVVLAAEDGKLAVGIAVAPRSHGLLVMATIFGPNGGAAGLKPRFRITGPTGSIATAAATPCSAGCYEAALPVQGMPRSAEISLADGSHLAFKLPSHGPSARALALVRAAAAEYKQIHSMVTHERLASGPGQVAYTTYYALAPDRLHYIVRGEGQSIIIGKRSWNRQGSGPWQESAQAPIDPIAPYWTPRVQDATILASTTVRGRRVSEVSFADPQTLGFFTIWVDSANHRTLELKMTAAAHFMHHSYGQFNAPLRIRPPRSR